ncbi:hypothetical protein GGH96_001365 [Coemansia sp. RSA 1972]|nr:hypothetical protein GGH96_001365 [Coemansia sp. RSA 1972]
MRMETAMAAEVAANIKVVVAAVAVGDELNTSADNQLKLQLMAGTQLKTALAVKSMSAMVTQHSVPMQLRNMCAKEYVRAVGATQWIRVFLNCTTVRLVIANG